MWRFRDSARWYLDPPAYFDPPPAAATGGTGTGGRLLSYTPPQPLLPLAPERDDAAPTEKNDKYKAGWLVPDALRQSPRLQAQLELVRRHLLAIRDALVLAHILRRTLVLPELPCVCDRSEAPSILQHCVYEAADLQMPFVCPIAHIFDLPRLLNIQPVGSAFGGHLGKPPPRGDSDSGLPWYERQAGLNAGVELRESAFLRNPRTHPRYQFGGPGGVQGGAAVRVAIARNASHAAALAARGGGGGDAAPFLREGASDVQVLAALDAHPAPRLHLESTEGIFGGWVGRRSRDEWEANMGRFVSGGSWCCSSWYKPSGSFDFAYARPTLHLPSGCGQATRDGAAAFEAPECLEAHRRRRAEQQPLVFFQGQDPDAYVPAPANTRLGKDGYYFLRRRKVES